MAWQVTFAVACSRRTPRCCWLQYPAHTQKRLNSTLLYSLLHSLGTFLITFFQREIYCSCIIISNNRTKESCWNLFMSKMKRANKESLFFTFTLFSGGYYTIELANRRLRLVALNTNLYLSSSSSASNMVNEAAERASDEVGSEKSASNMVEKSWVWLNKTMREARKKKQNVSNIKWILCFLSSHCCC